VRGIEKGIYILPNLFTTGNLFFGFYAIVRAIQITLHGQTNFKFCAIAIFIAAIFDVLDGRVARKTNTASKFGVEYDSLADLVSFGLAPAIVMYLWALQSFEEVGWIGLFLYVACGALRLARFNLQSENLEKNYFQGLPIPMAAMMLVGSLLIWDGEALNDSFFFHQDARTFVFVLVYLLAVLMVSSIPYRSFKSQSYNKRAPFYSMIFAVLGIMLFAFKPWWTLYGLGCVYILSGPIEFFVYKKRATIPEKGKAVKGEDNIRPFVITPKADHEKKS